MGREKGVRRATSHPAIGREQGQFAAAESEAQAAATQAAAAAESLGDGEEDPSP